MWMPSPWPIGKCYTLRWFPRYRSLNHTKHSVTYHLWQYCKGLGMQKSSVIFRRVLVNVPTVPANSYWPHLCLIYWELRAAITRIKYGNTYLTMFIFTRVSTAFPPFIVFTILTLCNSVLLPIFEPWFPVHFPLRGCEICCSHSSRIPYIS